MPQSQCAQPPAPDAAPRKRAMAARRALLAAAIVLLAGCAQGHVNRRPLPIVTRTPYPPPIDDPTTQPPALEEETSVDESVLPRSAWARGAPVPSLMQRMTTIRYITVHHDGMDPFYATDQRAVSGHLEKIRGLHRNRGWGDIGYHFAVDRAGRVWEARPLTYQGAHVKDHNPGNIGIVVLGNFEEQRPTPAQLAALDRHIRRLQSTYSVPDSRIRTHQEWAATACPGAHLQSHLVELRAASPKTRAASASQTATGSRRDAIAQ